MKTLRCKDAGLDCDEVITGNTSDEVLRKAAEHASQKHGMSRIDIEARNKMVSLIKDEPNR